MWIGVAGRFRRFHDALQLTTAQVEDGLGKQFGVRQCFERIYWGDTTNDPPGFIVGSWGKATAIRPPSDVDVFMHLPVDVYERFNGYSHNGQSALLQEIKGHLESTYSQTRMRGDGQVVLVSFNTVEIEVVPVFNYDSAGRWVMPDTHGGGTWKTVNPNEELAAIDRADAVSEVTPKIDPDAESLARPLLSSDQIVFDRGPRLRIHPELRASTRRFLLLRLVHPRFPETSHQSTERIYCRPEFWRGDLAWKRLGQQG